jgi:histone H3/H4
MAERAEDFGAAVAKEAVELTKYADRKTVLGNDIKLATERINRR